MRRHEWTAALGSALALSLLFAAKVFRRAPIASVWDWDYTFTSQAIAARTVREFGQIPLWTPFVCGGMPYLGNPQSRLLTPAFLPYLVLSPDHAARVELVVHLAAAFVGAFYLARSVRLSRSASFVSALVFPTCSFHLAHFAVGHAATALPLALLPWPLALGLRALATRRASFAALAGLVLAVMFGEGGAYALSYGLLLLGALLGVHALVERRLAPLGVLASSVAFTLAFGAAKFLVTFEVMQANPRHTARPETFPPALMLRALLSHDQDIAQFHPHQLWGWYEYGAYVSPAFVALALLGAVAARKRTWPYAAGTLLFCALAFGHLPEDSLASPWALLHRIPPFSSLRAPSRFLAVVVLLLGLLAGFGTELLQRRLSRRAWAAVLAVVALSLVDAWVVGTPALEHAFRPTLPAPAAPTRPPRPFAQYLDTSPPLMVGDDGASPRMYPILRSGHGVVNCYEPIQSPSAAVGTADPRYRGEQYLTGPGSLRLVAWSPERLTFDVNADTATTLVVNQNFDAHFRLTEGRGSVLSEHGLLAVKVPKGAQRVTLVYRCAAFWWGLALALAAATISAFLWLGERRVARRSGDAGSADSPP